ncbi:PTS lactose transporter subunit IIB [bacterium C-53]|nr:PTS lactose transporter subunit IIB [Lachnospiraceae bacterium]NBI01448.1 PTS lactose transporter subunit IIB [Lachnospiraceae bacterium]RKJ12760.1 PTS lactose transporter subunit IIB [bacterium C-53]
MAKENYGQLAKEIVAAVGGKENIISVTNCMTRLRFVLKDDSIPEEDTVRAVKGVKGIMNKGGQYQVIIGTHVSEVVKFAKAEAGISDDGNASVDKDAYKVMKKDSLWNRFFKIISGCIMPMIGPMIAGGVLKGILVILTTAGVLTNTDGTYLVLYAASDALLYFMPIIVGFSCGKIFDCNPYTTAAIGAALVYPNLVSAIAAEGGITFLHIPISTTTYSSTLFPIILASFVASKIEKLAKKILPQIIQLMIVPTIVLAVTVPLSYLVIGPVMQYVSNGLSAVVCGIFNFSPILGGLLFGAFWQLVVLLGLHAAFIPVLMNNLFSMGSDPINAVLGLTVWALAGVTLGYALRNKDPEKRSAGFGSMASALCGVTEPAIYSVAVPNMKLFGCAWIGGGISGAILGGLGGKLYALAGDGFFWIPGMINPEGLDISFYGFIACAAIAFTVSAVLAFVVEGKSH